MSHPAQAPRTWGQVLITDITASQFSSCSWRCCEYRTTQVAAPCLLDTGHSVHLLHRRSMLAPAPLRYLFRCATTIPIRTMPIVSKPICLRATRCGIGWTTQ
jgi:hypothetical protein